MARGPGGEDGSLLGDTIMPCGWGRLRLHDGDGPGDRQVQGDRRRQGRDGRLAPRPALQAGGDGFADLRKDGEETAALEMSLIGSSGEVCSNLTVDGGQPPKPEFTITDDKGKVVEAGSFEYG